MAEEKLRRLLEVMRRLRDPAGGCPWDQVQDFAHHRPLHHRGSLRGRRRHRARRPCTALPDELGDLLFQVVYHAQIAEPRPAPVRFRRCRRCHHPDKMIRRHPHVFGDAAAARRRRPTPTHGRRTSGPSAAPPPRSGTCWPAFLPQAAGADPRQQARTHRAPPASASTGPTPRPCSTSWTRRSRNCAPNSARPTRLRLADEVGDMLFVVANLARKLGPRSRDLPACRPTGSSRGAFNGVERNVSPTEGRTPG